jgi:three-Cys-motif partner protein
VQREAWHLSDFFEEPQGAAILKHEVLGQYLPIYGRKTGSRTPVVFVDGYAGPGRYADGSPGSPQLMVQTARALRSANVHCVFVERERAYREQLTALLVEELGDQDSEVFDGRIEERLEHIVQAAAGKSLFIFLDPFGLAIPFQLLTSVLRSRPRSAVHGWQPTEVLLNFSVSGINRAAGRLDGVPVDQRAERYRAARLEQLDAFLGGRWWHDIWRAHPPEGRVQVLLDGYLTRLRQALPGWHPLPIPVRDRYGGPVTYYLVLLSQRPEGLWFFNTAVSHGAKKLHDFTFTQQPVLIPPDLEQDWQGQLERSIKALLDRGRPFRLCDETRAVYGDTLGLAREMHVRDALEALHERGETPTSPKGVRNLDQLRVLPPRR